MIRTVLILLFLLRVAMVNAGNTEYCTKQTGRFLEFSKASKADSAIRCFHRMLYSCNTIKDPLFVQVIASYKTVLNKAIVAKDTALVHQCIDSLNIVYQQRAKHVGACAAHTDDYINLVLRVCPSKSRLAYDASAQYLATTADTGSNIMLLLHVRTAVACFKRGILNQSTVLESVFRVRQIIDFRIAHNPKDQANFEVKKEITRLYEHDVAIDCSTLDAFVGSNYKKVSRDTLSLKVIAWMLTVKCPDSEQFSVTLLQLSELVKASGLFADIARNFAQQNRLDKAQEYFKKAINLEMNKMLKAQYHYELATVSAGNYQFAYEQCKKAIQYNPHHGLAWLWMAQLLNSNASVFSGIDQKTVFCLATAHCIKAKYADPSIAANANKQLSIYSSKLPTANELSVAGLKPQQNYTLSAWPNETFILKIKEK